MFLLVFEYELLCYSDSFHAGDAYIVFVPMCFTRAHVFLVLILFCVLLSFSSSYVYVIVDSFAGCSMYGATSVLTISRMPTSDDLVAGLCHFVVITGPKLRCLLCCEFV